MTGRRCEIWPLSLLPTAIIEPEKEPLKGLEKTLRAICHTGGGAIVIVSPDHGDHREDGTSITNLLQTGWHRQ